MDCTQSEADHPRRQSADLEMKPVEFADTDAVRAAVRKQISRNNAREFQATT